MTEHKNQPTRQEVDMLETLLEERRRTADKARLRPPRRTEGEKSDAKPDGRKNK